MPRHHAYTFDRVARIAITGGVVWGLIRILDYLSPVLLPFFVALLLAYLINPLADLVERRVKNRPAAVLLSLFLLLATGLAATWTVIPLIGHEVASTSAIVRDFLSNSELAQKAAQRLPPDLWKFIKEQLARPEIQDVLKGGDVVAVAKSVGQRVLPGVWGVITGTANFVLWLFGLLIILLYVVFLLLDYRKVQESWRELLPARYREPAAEFLGDFEAGMQRYFRAQAVVAGIVGVLFCIGFTLIGLPMAIVMGITLGILNMVPYLQIIGMVPAFLLAGIQALESGGGFLLHLGLVGAVFAVVQTTQDGFLVPRFMNKATGLTPAVILLSLSIWGRLLGILGLVIALPMTVLLFAYYKRFLASIHEAPEAEAEKAEKMKEDGISPEDRPRRGAE